MNRFNKLSLLALIASLSVSAMGASIDHIQNYSAEYGANPAQQGAINTGSSVYFNPAGLMRLEDGTYIVGGIQYAFGSESMKEGGRDFSSNLSSPIPNFAIYKKTDNGAYFWTIGAVGGGAELEYKDSVPLIINVPGVGIVDGNNLLASANLKGSNEYVQTTVGKAYNLTDKWSASLAIRGVYAKRSLEAKAETNKLGQLVFNTTGADFDSEREAYGLGGQFGLNYAPNDKLNVGFRYDTRVKLNFENDVNYDKSNKIATVLLGKYPVYAKDKARRDLPALAALGASYKVTDQWTTFIGGNYYFNEAATMDRVGSMNVDYENGWEISAGSEYWFTSQFAWLVGFNYANTGAPDKSFTAVEFALDSTMLGTGIKYKPNDSIEWTVAFNHYIYDSRTVENIKYEKEISSIGFNFVKKF